LGIEKEIQIGPDGKIIVEGQVKKSFEEMTTSEMVNMRQESADRALISAFKTICTL
jgi:hypothetical protein